MVQTSFAWYDNKQQQAYEPCSEVLQKNLPQGKSCTNISLPFYHEQRGELEGATREKNGGSLGRILPISLAIVNYTLHDSTKESIESLRRNRVSGHIIIDEDGNVIETVSPEKRAWHAGVSSFREHPNQTSTTNVNSASYGILLVNQGPVLCIEKKFNPVFIEGTEEILGKSDMCWQPYTDEQITTLAILYKGLQKEYPTLQRLVGHGEVAPRRKIGPGAAFPWEKLAKEHGITMWPQISPEQQKQLISKTKKEGIEWAQQALNALGYDIPVSGIFDNITRSALQTFQMHYRPTLIAGDLDDETLHILNDLLKQIKAQEASPKETLPPCFE